MGKKTQSPLDPRLKPIVEAFKTLLREHDVSMAEMERRCGMSSKYLYKVLSGYQDLKFIHLLDVLDELGVPHREFWARLSPHPELPENLSQHDFVTEIEKIVNDILNRRGDA